MTDRTPVFEAALAPAAGRTALIVVDMQRAFVEPGEAIAVPQARDVVPRIQELLAVFRARRLPVVFTEFLYRETAPLLVGELHPEHRRAAPGAPRGFGRPSSSCLAGEANVATIAELAPRAGDQPPGDHRHPHRYLRARHRRGRVQPRVPDDGGRGRGGHAVAPDPGGDAGHHRARLRAREADQDGRGRDRKPLDTRVPAWPPSCASRAASRSTSCPSPVTSTSTSPPTAPTCGGSRMPPVSPASWPMATRPRCPRSRARSASARWPSAST